MHHDAPHMLMSPPGNQRHVWQFTNQESSTRLLHREPSSKRHDRQIRVTVNPVSEEPGQHEMRGMYGDFDVARVLGTSWQPDASPHQGIHAMYGDWSTMTHGVANLVYDRQAAEGRSQTFSTSMFMMWPAAVAAGRWGCAAWLSADPLMGKSGYPLLLQTGESPNGAPLIDGNIRMTFSSSSRLPTAIRFRGQLDLRVCRVAG